VNPMIAQAIRTLWIDGQNKDGSDAGRIPLELRQDDDGRYRWYYPAYDHNGHPAGACTEASEVCGDSEDEALSLARLAWAGREWGLSDEPPLYFEPRSGGVGFEPRRGGV